LLVGNGNWIVTVRFVVEAATARQMGSGAYISGCHLHVGLSEGEQLIAKESGTSKDLVLLEIDSKTKVPNREILESTAGVGDRVLALLRGQHGERRLEVGSFVGVTEGGDLGEGRVLVSLHNIDRGSGGLPVVDSEGDLVGLIFAMSREGSETIFLVSAADVVAFVATMMKNRAVKKS
jgi:S1-C subfamily serine protease